MKCRGIGPYFAVRGKSHEFSRVVAGTWCIFSSYGGDGHLKLGFFQQGHDPCLVMMDTWRSYTMLGRKIQTLLEVSQEAKLPLLAGTVILVFLSIFTKSQASSPSEALNSAHLSMSQMDVRPSVQKRLRTMAFSRVSTADSDIPSSCEMKDETAFKAVQGNPAFFLVRASRGPLYLRQKTQSRSHIPISEGRLPLRCLWKAGLPLQSKTGNHSHPHMIWGARKFPHCSNVIDDPLYLRRFSQGISRVS